MRNIRDLAIIAVIGMLFVGAIIWHDLGHSANYVIVEGSR